MSRLFRSALGCRISCRNLDQTDRGYRSCDLTRHDSTRLINLACKRPPEASGATAAFDLVGDGGRRTAMASTRVFIAVRPTPRISKICASRNTGDTGNRPQNGVRSVGSRVGSVVLVVWICCFRNYNPHPHISENRQICCASNNDFAPFDVLRFAIKLSSSRKRWTSETAGGISGKDGYTLPVLA